jgi:hypothetical protein
MAGLVAVIVVGFCFFGWSTRLFRTKGKNRCTAKEMSEAQGMSNCPPFFLFRVEEAASCKRDRLSKSTSSKSKLNYPNLTKAVRQHLWDYALYMPLLSWCYSISRSQLI